MEKTRVKSGEKYWLIRIDVNGVKVYCHEEGGWESDKRYFESGNYFHTEEEAEEMARKLRAVLNGADVIEMPSEEEIKKSVDYIASECVAEPTGWIEELQRPELSFKDLKDAIVGGINLLKSKIVK